MTEPRLAGKLAARLMVVTDLEAAPQDLLLARVALLASLAAPGTMVVQLRDKERSARDRLALGRMLVAILRHAGQGLLVNDRCDLARLMEADGAHLPEGGLATADARRLLGEGALVTRASHTASDFDEEADGVVLSPIVEPRKGRPALGYAAIGQARARFDAASEADGRARLLFALGGITAESVEACLEAGADGVAVIGAAFVDASPERLVAALGIARTSG